ncbi:MAG: GNAT family N-acetyltransferase [Deltaproteobacteria bacterium]|nr:GNAT family N-acetyltransferase [Deltaproteobacteria bacterium]
MDLEALLRKAWGRLPDDVRVAVYPRLRRLYSAAATLLDLRSLLNPLSSQVVTGTVVGNPSASLRLLIAGTPQDVRSLGRLILGEVPAGPFAPTALWQANRAVCDGLATADAVIVAVPAAARRLLPPSLVILPESVEVVLPVADAVRRWHSGRQPFGRYQRKIRASRLALAIERGLAPLEHFYRDFYLPYVTSRFGAWADVRPWRFYRRHVGQMELLWVLQDGRKIAAQVSVHHEDRYRVLDTGYRHGDPNHLAQGAGHALYAAALWRAAELGYSEIDHGPERPLLAHPQLEYKLAWGAQLRPNRWSRRILAVGFRDPSKARDLLEGCPLLLWHGSRLHAVVEPQAPAARIVALRRRYGGAGIVEFARWPPAPRSDP